MNTPHPYGHKLSDDEYEKAVVKLHTSSPAMPSREQDLRLRHQELQLMIDHRLGRDFPDDKRQALWATQQKMEKKRLLLSVKSLLSFRTREDANRQQDKLARLLLAEYSKVIGEKDALTLLSLESEA